MVSSFDTFAKSLFDEAHSTWTRSRLSERNAIFGVTSGLPVIRS
jgi:hypothetical protein